MRLVVGKSVLEPPLLDTGEARYLEIRDDAGRLQAVFLFPNAENFLFSHRQEPGFEAFAKGCGFQLQSQSAT